MEQSVEKIIKKFNSVRFKENFLANRSRELMASLYALVPNANDEVLELLRKDSYILDLFQYLTNEEIDILCSEYSTVIHYCYESETMEERVWYEGRRIHKLPKEVIELCVWMLKPEDNSHIFMPFSSEAQFAFYTDGSIYDGFEIDERPWAFSQVLLSAKNTNVNIEKLNKPQNAFSLSKTYDYVVSSWIGGQTNAEIVEHCIHILQGRLHRVVGAWLQ